MKDFVDPSAPASPEGSETLRETLQDYAVIMLDVNGTIVQWSEGAEKVFGYSAAEAIGQPVAVLFTPEDQTAGRPAAELKTAARKGLSEDQRWHVRKDGSYIWASGTVRALRNENGALTGFSKIARDMTPQKRAEMQREELLEREQAARAQAEQRWKHLEEISENIPAIIGLVRLPDQVYVFANRMFRETVGSRQLMGRNFRDSHPEVEPKIFDIFDNVAATGQVYRATERGVGGRYFDFVFQPMSSEVGQYEAILIFAVDVSQRVAARHASERLTEKLQAEGERLKAEIAERKRAEELASQRAELVQEQAALINLAHDAILTLRLDASVELWSRGAEETYGWKEAEALGRNVHELLHTESPEGIGEIRRKLLSEGQWSGELTQKRRDGQVIEVSSRWVLWRRGGAPYGWLEINRDITERKRMEAHLRDTQKMESLGVLAGGIAHDFNNLLTGVMGNISLAMDMMESDSQIHAILANSLHASEQAAFLTKQILAYAGKGQFIVQAVDLSAVVYETIALIGSSIPKTVTVEVALADELPPVEADITQLQQVVMNLIFNAAEAIGERSGRVVIRTRIEEEIAVGPTPTYDIGPPSEGPCVVLEVQDNGAGIEPLVRPNMFDPFFTTKFTGRGLGLAAVSGIVRSLNGAVVVDSTPGEGTTFRVLLPARRRSDARAPAPKLPVLVVDDEAIVRRTAEAMLRKRGCEVVLAENGVTAVEQFRRLDGRVALVLLDMSMPVMSGEDVFRTLKSIRPDVPVIVCSGYSEQEAIRRFGGLGVGGFIQKPYTVKTLMEKIEPLL